EEGLELSSWGLLLDRLTRCHSRGWNHPSREHSQGTRLGQPAGRDRPPGTVRRRSTGALRAGSRWLLERPVTERAAQTLDEALLAIACLRGLPLGDTDRLDAVVRGAGRGRRRVEPAVQVICPEHAPTPDQRERTQEPELRESRRRGHRGGWSLARASWRGPVPSPSLSDMRGTWVPFGLV